MHYSQVVNKKGGAGKYVLTYFVYFLFIFWLALGFSHPSDLGYILICTVIAIASFVVIFNPWNEDLFEPIKLAAAFYGMSFGIGPLLVGPFGTYDILYLGSQVSDLLRAGAFLSLIGFLCMIAAYYLIPASRHRSRRPLRTQSRKPTQVFLIGGVVVMLAGFTNYLILVKAAGGFGQMLSYSGGRADIFQGAYGGFFWGTFFLISGFSVVGAAIVAQRPWTVLGLGIVISALLALFQGRAAAIAPVFISIILIYYGYKRLSMRTLAITGIALLFFASALGAYRVTEDKSMVSKDVTSFLLAFSANAHENLLRTLSIDVERLDMFLVCYRYVNKERKTLGGKTLFGWLAPVDRQLFGGTLGLKDAGPFVNSLVNPHQKFNRTGTLVSLPGELYLSFGLWGLILGQLLYGALLKKISTMTQHHPIRPLTLAIYPYLTFIVTYCVLTGTVQLFYLATVMVGIFIAMAISGFRTDKPVLIPNHKDTTLATHFAQRRS